MKAPPSEQQIIDRLLDTYDLGALRKFRPHGGTAAKNWRLVTDRGEWLVRMRGVRTSSDELIAFDHGLRRHLLEHGAPTAAAVATRAGETFLRIGGRAFEVYPLIPGESRQHAAPETLTAAARALARFHEASADFADARSLPDVAQYSTLGLERTSSRMEDPELLALVYGRLASGPGAGKFAEAVEVADRWLTRLRSEFDRAAYDRLPHTVTHGDYTLANLIYAPDGSVCGIFDFDWARWAPRVRDIADGMFFLAGKRRTPLRPGDIWSLTEAVDHEPERCALWIDAYREVSPLSRDELHALPLALAARWLSIRVEGMAKVPDDKRLEFCFANLPLPLAWLEENWGEVLRAVGG